MGAVDQPHLQVQVGDWITDVNGFSKDPAKMLDAMRDTVVTLTVKRPSELEQQDLDERAEVVWREEQERCQIAGIEAIDASYEPFSPPLEEDNVQWTIGVNMSSMCAPCVMRGGEDGKHVVFGNSMPARGGDMVIAS